VKAARVVHVTASPLQITAMLEQARAELDRGSVSAARTYVQHALERLAVDRGEQDAVLDADARTPEAPAPREKA